MGVFGTLGYFYNKVTDEITASYPGSSYDPKTENPNGAYWGIAIGATVGLFITAPAM